MNGLALNGNVVTTCDGMRLRRRHYDMSATPVEVHNASDRFNLIMPPRHGRVRLDREKEGLFEGDVKPGTVRFVQPDERAQVTALTTVDEIMLYIPGSLFRRQASVQGLNVDGRTCPEIVPSSRPITPSSGSRR